MSRARSCLLLATILLTLAPPGLARGSGQGNVRTQTPPYAGYVQFRQEPCVSVPVLDDRCELWAAAYDHAPDHPPGSGGDSPLGIAAADGRVFVTGLTTETWFTRVNIATVAFDAQTGSQLWEWQPNTNFSYSVGRAITTSGDGSRVFVTGTGMGGNGIWTGAHDARTGELLWSATHGSGYGWDIVATRDGSRVYVVGSGERDRRYHYVTIAYDGATGRMLWASRLEDAHNGDDHAVAIALSPDERRLYATGKAQGDWSYGGVFFTVAYDSGAPDQDGSISPTAGEVLWQARYDGDADQPDAAADLAVDPSGSRIYVTGTSRRMTAPGADLLGHYVTIAYDAATGTQLWLRTDRSPTGSSAATAITVAAEDQAVVTGVSSEDHQRADYKTIAYRAVDGEEMWSRTYDFLGYDTASEIAASPDGQEIYVTGGSDVGAGSAAEDGWDATTVAYRASDGKTNWTARFSNSAAFRLGNDKGIGIAVEDDRIFVLDRSAYRLGDAWDYMVLAY